MLAGLKACRFQIGEVHLYTRCTFLFRTGRWRQSAFIAKTIMQTRTTRTSGRIFQLHPLPSSWSPMHSPSAPVEKKLPARLPWSPKSNSGA